MAVAVKDQASVFDKALDFVEDAFTNAGDGDLQAAARAAAMRCRRNGLISGPMWDEMGEHVLAHFFRLRRIHVLRRWSSGHRQDEDQAAHAADHRGADPADTLYFVSGSWARLGDLGRAALYQLRDARMAQATGLIVEARLFERLAKGLKGDDTVADRYSSADLLRIREEVEREER